MTAILFRKNIEDSPYKAYFQENYWKQMETLLVEDTCKLLSNYSPLC